MHLIWRFARVRLCVLALIVLFDLWGQLSGLYYIRSWHWLKGGLPNNEHSLIVYSPLCGFKLNAVMLFFNRTQNESFEEESLCTSSP